MLYTGYLAIKIESKDRKIKKIFIKNIKTSEEKIVDTDLLIIATGTKPEISLAKKAGCKIGKTGGIIVDDKSVDLMKLLGYQNVKEKCAMPNNTFYL